jgi:SAM-dependent MidA family methyltransferase
MQTALERELISRIKCEGPATFRDFMQAALYDPKHGYYNTDAEKIGRSGDYYTSSNVHSAFGGVLAGAFVELLNELPPADGPPTIVEAGAGTGQLASDILSALRLGHREIFESLNYILVETSPAMRTRQQRMLAGSGDRVMWRSLDELAQAPVCGIIFSNEMIDALPVHCVRLKHGILEEMCVGVEPLETLRQTGESAPAHGRDPHKADSSNSHLCLEWRAPSTPRLREYLERCGVTLAEGQKAEINLDAIDWLGKVAGALKAGFLATIDYGDVAGHLYGPDRFGGTLRSFYRHRLTDSVLERVGEQDITASVNFTALIEYGADCGFERVSYHRQVDFLMRNGLIDRIAAMGETVSATGDNLKDRIALKNLFVPGGVSDNFRVLIQRKGDWRQEAVVRRQEAGSRKQ